VESFDSRVFVNEYGTRVWEGLFYSEMVFGAHEALISNLIHILLYPTGAFVADFDSVGGPYRGKSGFIPREDILKAYGKWHDVKSAAPKSLALQAVQLLRSGPNPYRDVPAAFIQELRERGREWR
jgi:hypothetical protein